MNTEIAINIVPFTYTDAEYTDMVAVGNATLPLYPSTVADWKRWEANRNKAHVNQRYRAVSAETDQTIAYAIFQHTPWTFHPQRFDINIQVHPKYQHRGVGRRLYNHLMAELAPYNPLELESSAQEDRTWSRRFLTDRGFKATTIVNVSGLDLAAFNREKFAPSITRAQSNGIHFTNLTEISKNDPDHLRKLYDILHEVDKDVPWHNAPTHEPFDERWIRRFESDTNRIPEAFIIAKEGDEYVGLTMLKRTKATDTKLFTGLTGVRRPWRRKGVAKAMKTLSLSYARENFTTTKGGAPVVITENEENNPMFTLNVQLGFVKQPGWFSYAKKTGALT